MRSAAPAAGYRAGMTTAPFEPGHDDPMFDPEPERGPLVTPGVDPEEADPDVVDPVDPDDPAAPQPEES